MAGVQEARNGRRPQPPTCRVLVFPLPFQGHIDPMLHLAGVLQARGLAVTVLHTRFNALDPSRHPEFPLVPVPDGTPADVAATGRIIDVIRAMNVAMETSAAAAVTEALASAAAPAADQARASCLFIDSNLLAVQRAARKIGLPTLVLRTGSAACFGCFLAYPMLHDKGYLPPRESELLTPVPELPPLRVKDLVYSRHSDHALVCEVLARGAETVRGCAGMVVNTFEALEPAELARLRDELPELPVILAAGPLHKLNSCRGGAGSSLLAPDRSCIEWLDTQRAGSVLYVSFGSLAAMDASEFAELAWGLAESGHPFLWVVRPNQVRGGGSDNDAQRLPDGVEDAVRAGRGMVVRWAPQQEVLAHRAVGGFWSHCGWNSTLEAITEGVPMICRPDAVDQMMNTRYVQDVWGVGFELEGELERGKVRDAVRKLMGEREGDEMRRRAQELRGKVNGCLGSPAGPSQVAIDKLVEYIMSLRTGLAELFPSPRRLPTS